MMLLHPSQREYYNLLFGFHLSFKVPFLINNCSPFKSSKEMPSDLVVELPKSRHKADTIPASQPKRSKSSKKQSKSRESTPPPPVKIAILKREEKVPAVAAENSVSVQKDNSSSAQSARLNADLKAAIFFMLEASSKKRDAVILSEIQKTIKSEISGSVIPALGKVVTQSIEQSVAKPLQVALSKNAKESSKVRTKEVIEAVSSSIKEPVTDAFHKVCSFLCKYIFNIHTGFFLHVLYQDLIYLCPTSLNM